MPYRGDLPALVIKPTEGGRKLLALLVAAGMNKVEIEQLLKSQLNKKLEDTLAAGAVTEVFLYDTKDIVFVDDKQRVRNSRGAADFTEVGRALITLKESGHESVVAKTLRSELNFTLGDALDLPSLDQFQFVFPLGRRFSGTKREEIAQTALQLAEARAKTMLVPDGGPLFRVQIQMIFDFKDKMRTEAMKRTNQAQAERQLMSLLGGTPFGIMAVALAVAPASNAVQWSDEHSIYVQGDNMMRNLITRLSSDGGVKGADRGASADVIKRVRMVKKFSPTITPIRQKQAVLSAAKASATVAQLETAIATGVFESDLPVVFPTRTKENKELIWTTRPATETEAEEQQTTLEQLPEVMLMDGFTELRSILHDEALEYNASVLFEALMNLIKSSMLMMEPSDDDTHYLLFSALKYGALTKKR